MNSPEEVAVGFVVTGCDGAELLEPGEEVLDQVARFVEVVIVVSGHRDRRKIGGAAASWLFPRLFSGRGWMRGLDGEVGGSRG